MIKICRVVSQTDPVDITTKEGPSQKCFVRLKEIGNIYAEEFNCSVLGNQATVKFEKGDVVAAVLHFSVHEAAGNMFQDVTAKDIVKLRGDLL